MHPLKFPVTINSKSTKSTAIQDLLWQPIFLNPYTSFDLIWRVQIQNLLSCSKYTAHQITFKFVLWTWKYVHNCIIPIKNYYIWHDFFLISRITPALMDHHCQDVTVKTIILLLPLIGIPAHQPWLSILWIFTKFWLM